MRLDKFTLRGQEAIQSAIELAERNQHQQVEPEHLLAVMLEQPEGIVRPILGKLGANVAVILNDTQAAVARFPRVQGGQQYFSSRLSQIFTASQNQACLLYTSDAADERSSVDLGGRRIIKKK